MKYITLLLISILLITFTSCNEGRENIEFESNSEQNESNFSDYGKIADTIVHRSQQLKNQDSSYSIPGGYLLGLWVGQFKPDSKKTEVEEVGLDEGLYWDRSNKISIEILKVFEDSIYGRSIVAGNLRSFNGTFISYSDSVVANVREPGDDKYDGVFHFKLYKGKFTGAWSAFGQIEVPYRIFSLEPKTFIYKAEQMLEPSRMYAEWDNYKEYKEYFEEEGEEVFEWMQKIFSASTKKIYDYNASTALLKKEDVENMVKGDLIILRNTIYARHGYSFKDRSLRTFFDQQNWYIPYSIDIREKLTDIEKNNIKLLLKYEEHAETYYDSFGRG